MNALGRATESYVRQLDGYGGQIGVALRQYVLVPLKKVTTPPGTAHVTSKSELWKNWNKKNVLI